MIQLDDQVAVQGMYPNNEPVFNRELGLPNFPSAMTVRPYTFQQFVSAMFLADAYAMRGQKIPVLILPLVPGSRQDRLNTEGDFLFTLKSVADMINMREFKEVHILDPHSDVSAALINNCRVHNVDEIVNGTFFSSQFTSVIAPDAGAAKRAEKIAKLLQIPLFQAWKERDIKTGALSGFGIEQYADLGTKPLIVDDLCDGGGTFIGLASTIDFLYGQMDKRIEYNAMEFYLYVTHGLFTKGYEGLLNHFKKIYTTDSYTYRDSHKDIVVIEAVEKLQDFYGQDEF